jgi:hypothetical protein
MAYLTAAIRAWHQRGPVTERGTRGARALTGQANLGRDTSPAATHGAPSCDPRGAQPLRATTSGAEVGQTRGSQMALNGCDDAHRSTRNPRKTGVSTSSIAGQHCCGPGCRGFESPRSPQQRRRSGLFVRGTPATPSGLSQDPASAGKALPVRAAAAAKWMSQAWDRTRQDPVSHSIRAWHPVPRC